MSRKKMAVGGLANSVRTFSPASMQQKKLIIQNLQIQRVI
jgi:hypothetical protein